MRQIYGLKSCFLIIIVLSMSTASSQITMDFSCTNLTQTFIIPDGVETIQIEAWGAQGQSLTTEDYDPSVGGLGGYASGYLNVIPGDTLFIFVGATGISGRESFNGGGIGGYGSPTDGSAGYAGSGGGASDVRLGGMALENRIIVAGGGGGGGRDYINGSCTPCGTGGNGGDGGAEIGENGDDPWYTRDVYINPGSGGTGGGPTYGGAGGDGIEGVNGNPGILGFGGAGIDGTNSVASGGGGGYYGGGSGAGTATGSGVAGGGGAGGSSFIGGVIDGVMIAGVNEGHGKVRITEVCNPLIVSVSADTICLGESITLNASSGMSGTITWDQDVINGESFTPDSSGLHTYIATSDLITDCAFFADIFVHDLPIVNANAAPEEICLGEPVMFYGDGAMSYIWDPEPIENMVRYYPESAGEFLFNMVGIDSNGCQNTDDILIKVNALPMVDIITEHKTICAGDFLLLNGEGAETYSWSPEILDGIPFVLDMPGFYTYSVLGTDSNACENTASIEIEVTDTLDISNVIFDEVYGSDGSIDLTVSGGAGEYQYDWDIDGLGDFDDLEDQTDLTAGTYFVQVKDEGTCLSEKTIIISSQLTIDVEEIIDLSVYPNPSKDNVFIELEGEFEFMLTTSQGRTIVQDKGHAKKNIDISELSNGVYFIKVLQNEKQSVVRLVKI